MQFSDSIPSKLQEYPTVIKFITLLDYLQDYKKEIMARSFFVNNIGVLMDRKWMLKILEEFGVSNIPLEYPIQSIYQFLLNVDTICGTRGSKIGIELYCSVLSLGEVTVDDENFYFEPSILSLNSVSQGFITENNSNKFYYICSDNSDIEKEISLKITVKSKFFDGKHPDEGKLVKSYLQSNINNQLSFGSRKTVTFDFQPRSEWYFHKLLNPYFV